MADRYPLIVDSATNTVKEIPAGDNVNLSGSDIVGLSSANVTSANHYVTGSAAGVGTWAVVQKEVNHAPAFSVTGFGSIGINTVSQHYLQIGDFKEYPIIGINTVVVGLGTFDPDGQSYNKELSQIFDNVQHAMDIGIATVLTADHLNNNLDGVSHGFTGEDGTLRYWDVLNGAGSPQFTAGGIVLVDVDKYQGADRWIGGPKDGGWLKDLTNNTGLGTMFNPTPCGIASRGIFVGLGCSDPLVRLDVEGDIHVRNKTIIFGMPQRGGNNEGYELIWMGDNNNPSNPGAFHFVTDGGLRERGNAHLYAGSFTGTTNNGWRQPSTFPFGVGIGTTAIATPAQPTAEWYGDTGYNALYRLHVNGYARFTSLPNSTSATTLVIDDNGLIRPSSSSRRYKENIQSYEKGLEDVLKLNPVTFNYIADGNIEDEFQPTVAGLIAEDVHDAGLGEFVVYGSQGTLPESINYGNMMALMVNAMKELKAENDSLKEEIAAIKAHIGL